nr:nucleotidyltransferase domain-containing protein [Anaerolineae bacterium]
MSGPLRNLEPYRQPLDEAFERHGVVLAYLFGSQARGEAGPLSDVDVAVLFGPDVPENERFDRVLHLIGELGSLFHRNDVYVVDLAEAPPLLRHRVYYDGRLLYCADDAERVRFETTALRDYVDTEPLRRIKRKYVLQHFGLRAGRRT